jgi:glycosyltransferase involved in cell wall biosynthesis
VENIVKILIISQHFFPKGHGGGPYQVKALADALDEAGQKVYFLGPEGGEEYLNDSIDYFGVKWEGWINKGQNIIKIRKIIEQEDIDIVHSQFAYPAGVLADKALRISNIPHVITSHGVDIRPPGQNSYLTDTKKKYLVQNTLARVDKHIVASEEMKLLAMKAGSTERKIVKIANILPSMPDVTDDEAADVLESYEIERDYILSLSRLHPIKNIDDLIKAFYNIKDGFDVDLVVAGDGSAEENLRRLAEELDISDRVIFTGRVEGKDKTALYKKAKIFGLQSKSEGFGLTLLEAMSQQTPIVASNVGGIPEVVRDEKEALLHEPGDISTISGFLSELLEDKNLREKISGHQKARMQKKFSRERIVHKHIRLYEELLS